MNWFKAGFTTFIVVLWLVLLFKRHALTRKAAIFYRLTWSDEFKRTYANGALAAATVFYAFLIWLLWAEVPS
jgi:hypothetical protein